MSEYHKNTGINNLVTGTKIVSFLGIKFLK